MQLKRNEKAERLYRYLLFILGICFLIPILGTGKFKEKEEKTVENSMPMQSTYQYRDYQTIKLLHKQTEEIEAKDLDEYLQGVVASEMPVDFELEALKAQAIVARTYTMYKVIHNNGKHGEASICDDSTCCQAWISKEDRLARWEEEKRESNWNKIIEAVTSTQGKIITYQGEPINAFFHANSGGLTETPLHVWGGSGYPYLQPVATAGEEGYSQYYSEVILSKEEVWEKVKEKYEDIVIDWEQEKPIEVLDYTEGSRVKTLRVGNKELAGTEARTIFSLRSTDFTVEIQEEKIKFSVKGYRTWSRNEPNRSG